MKFAIITPSYHLDFERCALLAASILHWVPADVHHYIIVSREDQSMFQALAGPRTHILLQENLVRQRFWQLPFAKKWRLSLKMPPVRGWIWQQIVKLSIAEVIDAEAYMLVDSDCLFLQDFDPRNLCKDSLVPLFREQKPFYISNSDTQKWHEHARRLLRLPQPASPYDTGYVGPHVFWRRDVLLELYRYLGQNGSRNWVKQVAFCPTFSEYVLYGMFAEHVLGIEASGHYIFDQELVENYWPEKPMDKLALREFQLGISPEKVMVHINGKSRTPVDLIGQMFLPALPALELK